MVKYNHDEDRLNRVFMALADPTRREILGRLAEGEALVSELAAPFEMSLPAVSKHLGILERAGLLRREKDGRLRRCALRAEALQQAGEWIEFYQQFWERRLDSLQAWLEHDEPDDGGKR